MWTYKVLVNDGDAITDGTTSWYELREALDELGAQGYELVSGFRRDYVEKSNTATGIKQNSIIERELLFKREVNAAKGFMDRLFKR